VPPRLLPQTNGHHSVAADGSSTVLPGHHGDGLVSSWPCHVGRACGLLTRPLLSLSCRCYWPCTGGSNWAVAGRQSTRSPGGGPGRAGLGFPTWHYTPQHWQAHDQPTVMYLAVGIPPFGHSQAQRVRARPPGAPAVVWPGCSAGAGNRASLLAEVPSSRSHRFAVHSINNRRPWSGAAWLAHSSQHLLLSWLRQPRQTSGLLERAPRKISATGARIMGGSLTLHGTPLV
jgi:hypothetical protein